MQLVIVPNGTNLPPIQPHAVDQTTAPRLKNLIDPAIALHFASELVDAGNPGPQSLTPVRIDGGPGKTEVYNKVPGRMRPLPTPGQIFGMHQQNPHAMPFADTTISIPQMTGQATPSSRASLARNPPQPAPLGPGAKLAGATRLRAER